MVRGRIAALLRFLGCCIASMWGYALKRVEVNPRRFLSVPKQHHRLLMSTELRTQLPRAYSTAASWAIIRCIFGFTISGKT